jgi:hypothetical protein
MIRITFSTIALIALALPQPLFAQRSQNSRRPNDDPMNLNLRSGRFDPMRLWNSLSRDGSFSTGQTARDQRGFERSRGADGSVGAWRSPSQSNTDNARSQRREQRNRREERNRSDREERSRQNRSSSDPNRTDRRQPNSARDYWSSLTERATRRRLQPWELQLLTSQFAAPPPPPEKTKPIVFRSGQMPSDLPNWFARLDLNSDSQAGLYEWVDVGLSPDDFKAFDRNEDGFITAKEAIAQVRTGMTLSESAAAIVHSRGMARDLQTPAGPKDRNGYRNW